MSLCISLTLNGEARDVSIDDPRVTLLDLFRERLALPGTKKGCDHGQCGACTVLQCGYCTPGQIMSAVGLIAEGDAGSDPERIREGMSGNICRCGAYHGITLAVQEASRRMAAKDEGDAA